MKRDKQYYKSLIILSLFAVIVGIVVGVIDVIFGKTLLVITEFRQQHFNKLIPYLAFIGIFIVYMYKKFGKNCAKGMSLIFEVAQNKEKQIPLRLIPFVIISTWLTHLFGGSAGREGVAVQVGATFSNYLENKLKIKDATKICLLIGMSAGFAGLFRTPIAAVFFALEVLIVGSFHYRAILPSLIAAFCANATSTFLHLEKFTFNLKTNVTLNFQTFLKLALVGILFGLVGALFTFLLKYFKSFFAKKIKDPIKRIAIIAFILSFSLILFHGERYAGLGTNLINASFNGETIYYEDWLIKIIFTVITLSVGFQGGEVTPLFAIGSTFGVFLASYFGLDATFMSSLGYIAIFGSATNTFFAPIFIGCEVFGYNYMPYFFIVMVFAHTFNFNKSIYSLQETNYLERQ